MPKFVHRWDHDGAITTFCWLGAADIKPDRVYAIAFTTDRKILLVTDSNWQPACWLPGGGIEAGETPEQALARELTEEANAILHRSALIGIQQAEDSLGRRSYQAIYWCRITLESEFSPRHEVSERHLVRPEQFLDRLFWGHQDPKSEMLLQRALELEEEHRIPDMRR